MILKLYSILNYIPISRQLHEVSEALVTLYYQVSTVPVTYFRATHYQALGGRVVSSTECIVFARKSSIPVDDATLRNMSIIDNFDEQDDHRNMWSFAPPRAVSRDRNGKFVNPATKPVSLMRHIVQLFSKTGDLVLDLLAGLGPLTEASIMEGRHVLTVEGDANQNSLIISRVTKVYAMSRRGNHLSQTEKNTDGTRGSYQASIVWDQEKRFHVVESRSKKSFMKLFPDSDSDTDSEHERNTAASQAMLGINQYCQTIMNGTIDQTKNQPWYSTVYDQIAKEIHDKAQESLPHSLETVSSPEPPNTESEMAPNQAEISEVVIPVVEQQLQPEDTSKGSQMSTEPGQHAP